MKKSLKTKWIAALRSGKYTQGFNRLRKDDTFCCLGVLCDLYRQDHSPARWYAGEFIDEKNEAAFSMPTRAVQKWAGLDEDDIQLLAYHNDPLSISSPSSTLTSLPPHPFEDIADLIENYL
jgi:hypothetical protein